MAAPRYLTLNGNKKQLNTATQVSTGAGTGEVIVSTGADGFIDPSFIQSSEQIVKTASEALAQNDFVNVWNDGGVAKVRKADASAFATRAMGIVKDNYALNDPATVLSEGIIGGFVGLTIGDPVFLSTASGQVTQAPPTGAGEIWQIVGEAYSATEIRLEIEEPVVL